MLRRQQKREHDGATRQSIPRRAPIPRQKGELVPGLFVNTYITRTERRWAIACLLGGWGVLMAAAIEKALEAI